MSDRTRAAELADYIAKNGDVPLRSDGFDEAAPKKADADLIERALRAYAALPVATEGLREAMARAILSARNPYITQADSMPSYNQYLADAALAAIHDAGYVLAPREPDDATLKRIEQAIAEEQCISDGWPVSGGDAVYDAALGIGEVK